MGGPGRIALRSVAVLLMLGALLWQAVPGSAAATAGEDGAVGAIGFDMAAGSAPLVVTGVSGGSGSGVLTGVPAREREVLAERDPGTVRAEGRSGGWATVSWDRPAEDRLGGTTGTGTDPDREGAPERTGDDAANAAGGTAGHRMDREPPGALGTRSCDDGVPGDAPTWHSGARTGGPGGSGEQGEGDGHRPSGAQGHRPWTERHHDPGEDVDGSRDGGRDDRLRNHDDRRRHGVARAGRGASDRTPGPSGSAEHRGHGKPETRRPPVRSAPAAPSTPRSGRDGGRESGPPRGAGDSLGQRDRPTVDRSGAMERKEDQSATGAPQREVDAAGQGTDRVGVRASTSGVVSFGAGLVLIGLGIGFLGVRLRRG